MKRMIHIYNKNGDRWTGGAFHPPFDAAEHVMTVDHGALLIHHRPTITIVLICAEGTWSRAEIEVVQ
jgi:hypothetical protein